MQQSRKSSVLYLANAESSPSRFLFPLSLKVPEHLAIEMTKPPEGCAHCVFARYFPVSVPRPAV